MSAEAKSSDPREEKYRTASHGIAYGSHHLLIGKSYLGSRYRHLRTQLPSHSTAVKAMARYLAVLVYRMLTRGEACVDRSAARFEQRRTELELTTLNNAVQRLRPR